MGKSYVLELLYLFLQFNRFIEEVVQKAFEKYGCKILLILWFIKERFKSGMLSWPNG